MRRETICRLFEEQKAFVDARVQSGIELYRKGDLEITVTDASGNPLPNVPVRIVQTQSAFKFGANTFMINELETPEKNEIYKQKFAELFNLGTIPFYWKDVEPEQGKTRYDKDSCRIYRRPPIDLCMEFCRENGIEPKLHCLNYDQQRPQWTNGLTIPQYKALLSKRFCEIGTRYASRIPMVEVTNETLCPNVNTSPFFDADDFCQWSFAEARKFFPCNELIINEAASIWEPHNAETNRNPYFMQIQSLLREGVPVQGIGMQFHSFYRREQEETRLVHERGRYSPMHIALVLDRFATLNLPLQITEMTLPAYSWEAEDEDVQAELCRVFYSIFFAQRGMEAVIYWNLPDGYAYNAEPGDMTCGENYYYGGLLRFDMSEKPAYRMLKKLIHTDWRTNTTAVTDPNGRVRIRAFHGQYALSAHVGTADVSAKATLSPGAAKAKCTLCIH